MFEWLKTRGGFIAGGVAVFSLIVTAAISARSNPELSTLLVVASILFLMVLGVIYVITARLTHHPFPRYSGRTRVKAILGLVILLAFTVYIGLFFEPGRRFVTIALQGSPAPSPTFTSTVTPSTTPTPTPSLTPTLTPSPNPPTPLSTIPISCADFGGDIFDDFNGIQIDEDKWIVDEDDKEFIFVSDEALHFRVSREQSKQSVGQTMVAKPFPRAIKAICFRATLDSYGNDEPGGVGIEFYLANQRDFSVNIGPGPNGPAAEIGVCPAQSQNPIVDETPYPCGDDYDDHEHPLDGENERFLSLDEPVIVRVSWVEDYLLFAIYIDPERPVYRSVMVDDNLISEFSFTMYGDSGSIYTVVINELYIEYDDSL